MAEEQKPVAVPAEETAATTTTETTTAPAVDAVAPLEETAPAATEATKEPATETPAVEGEAAPAAEEAKKEVEPVEDGQLEHKGSNFPKNFIYSKKFFWFGSDAVEPKKFPGLLKDHHVAAWASETGKGLLFFSEKGQDKAAPTSAIALHEAAEPTTEGPNKFVLSSKGHKHTFKAANAADRDNWVSQIKLKIAEAKELATTVTESEQYKATLASFSPAVKKEEKKEEKAEAEAPKAAEETPAAEGAAAPATTEAVAATETPAEGEAKEEAKEEAADTKKDERKRSASRKRASIFGALLGGNKKESSAAKDVKAEDKKEEAVAEAPADAAATTETPAVAATETAEPATEAAKDPEAATETPAATEESKPKVAEKPTPTKRTSLFGGLSFGKKKPEEAAPATPAKDTPPVSEDAPVIPKPDTVEPLSTEVSSPANVPTETTEVAPAVNGEKKEVKSDKRKSSFPFALGKKNASNPTSPAAVEEGAASPDAEKAKSPNPFSKFRATIKNKGKAAEKPADKAEDKPAEGAAEEAAKPSEEVKAAEETKPETVAEEAEPAKDAPVASTPAVTASA
ncbi:Pleckstrin homology domain-containing protein [Diaporthe sp. PMI_573]|nr:Pleckstrin homology domain-containing protein [Diaporthaceae sp. PMI_573]